MDGFFVPQLGGQIYTMPGMATRLNLLADRPGDYPGLSSNFSGDGFSDMRFMLHAVPAPDYQQWLARTRGAAPTLDAAAYARLAADGRENSPHTYGGVDPQLFENIVQQTMPVAAAPGKDHY
jgi:cytochrome o ubiquinol oxidase subunit 2